MTSLLRLGHGARLVVVSPHLDDAVFSVGATLAEAAASGIDVVNVTVFAGVPDSNGLPGSWDRQARFSSDGAAARKRRHEDAAACRAIGIQPRWLPFRDDQYGDDRSEIWSLLAPLLADADAILVPGFPLQHPDHVWVTSLVWEERAKFPQIGFYVEQPYGEAVWFRRRQLPEHGGGAAALFNESIDWSRSRPRPVHWWQKQKGFAAYSSQLKAMTRPGTRVLIRVGIYDIRRRGEWLGFPASGGSEVGQNTSLRAARLSS
jgi:LmbE family N-acetylglucosaminyl deacetylase